MEIYLNGKGTADLGNEVELTFNEKKEILSMIDNKMEQKRFKKMEEYKKNNPDEQLSVLQKMLDDKKNSPFKDKKAKGKEVEDETSDLER